MIRFIVFRLLCLLIVSALFGTKNSFSQDVYKNLPPNNRTEYVVGDSIYYFSFLNSDKKIKEDINKRYYYFVNQELASSKGTYRGKVLHGPSLLESRSNYLIEKGNFSKGLKVGEWKLWHPNGEIRSISHFKKGIRSGEFKSYFESGGIKEEGKYRNELKSGRWNEYNNTNQLLGVIRFRNGVKQGKFIQYYSSGKISKKGNYKRGKQHGRVVTYDEKGQKQVDFYKNGELRVKEDTIKNEEQKKSKKTIDETDKLKKDKHKKTEKRNRSVKGKEEKKVKKDGLDIWPFNKKRESKKEKSKSVDDNRPSKRKWQPFKKDKEN